MERCLQMMLDAMTVEGLIMLDSCKAILRGKSAYFYQKEELNAIIDAIAMPLVITPILDCCDDVIGWKVKLEKGGVKNMG